MKVETPASQPTAAAKEADRVLPTAAVEDELLGLFPNMSEQDADRSLGISNRAKPKPRPQPRLRQTPPAKPKQQPQRIRPQQQEIRLQTPPPTDDLLDAFPDGSEEEADRLKGLR